MSDEQMDNEAVPETSANVPNDDTTPDTDVTPDAHETRDADLDVASHDGPAPRRVMHDVRALEPERFDEALLRLDASRGVMLNAWQAARAPREELQRFSDVVVVLPDFVNYARLLSTGQAGAMLKLPGSTAAALAAGMRAGLPAAAHPLKLVRQDFWLVAETLLRYDLALLRPQLAEAARLLHPNLADFAFAFGQGDFMRRAARLMGGQWGVFTQQLPMAAGALARWGLAPRTVAFLYPPGNEDTAALVADVSAGSALGASRLIADVSSLPADMQDVGELETLISAQVQALLFAPPGPDLASSRAADDGGDAAAGGEAALP